MSKEVKSAFYLLYLYFWIGVLLTLLLYPINNREVENDLFSFV